MGNQIWSPSANVRQSDMPPCFDSKAQWELWLEAWSRAHERHAHYCTDCTKDYQSKMAAEGRCRFPELKLTPKLHIKDVQRVITARKRLEGIKVAVIQTRVR